MSNASAVMAIVLFAFFIVGVGAGVLAVIAISVRRADRPGRRPRPPTSPQDEWPPVNETGPDDDEPDEPPWWQARGDS